MDAGTARIECAASKLAGARRLVARGILEPGEPRHHVVQLLHAGLDAGADVHQQAAALLAGAYEGVDDVVDVHEVARLRTVAEDHRPVAPEQLAGEDRY